MKSYPGVVPGVVKGKPDELGRVELAFPGIHETIKSTPAHISTPMAGGSRGQWFMPEDGDHVLVAFEHGRFEHPYVVGFLWNEKAKPPEQGGSDAYQNRVIKTPGGHTLRFEDKDGEKKIVIKSDGGHSITLDDKAKSVTVSGSGDANQVTIDTQGGKITIKASTQVSVQAPQIELTQAATHPVVFGDQLMTYLTQLVGMLQAHMHVGQLALGIFPVTPAPPATTFPTPTPSLISTKVTTG